VKAVVIGSGLGGLECGFILSRGGYDVTVLEAQDNIGGCLQSFSRRVPSTGESLVFDTGFHYVGSLGQGESLRRLSDYFSLSDLPWERMDPLCCDEVVLGGERFALPSNGHASFVETLSERFPTHRDNILEFSSLLKGVGDDIFSVFGGGNGSMDLFSKGAYGFLERTVGDSLLLDVLSGPFMRMELSKGTLPLYPFAQIWDSFVRSAWRLKGGGSLIAKSLACSIESFGGKVLRGMKAERILHEGGKVKGVEALPKDGKEKCLFPADVVVSDIHPSSAVSLVSGKDGLRPVYSKRISSLDNTEGVFTANIALKKGTLPYENRNITIYSEGASPWKRKGGTDRVMVHFYPCDGRWATHLDLISPMSLEETVFFGEGYSSESKYLEAKEKKLSEVLDLAYEGLPALKGAIEKVWTSTPLTWQRYTGTPGGSSFGVRKDWRNPLLTVLSPRTPLKGLYLTGQSLNLPGMLGVSMTSLLTCREIPGLENFAKEISQI